MSPLCARIHPPTPLAPMAPRAAMAPGLTPRRLLAIAAFCALLLGGRPGLAQHPTTASPLPLTPGDVALELSPIATSTLGIHPVYLNEVLCPPPPGGPQSGGVGECGITVNNGGPPGGTFNMTIANFTPNANGTTTATALPNRLSLAGPAPFDSSCGMWSYEVTLDPHAVQPPAALRLGQPAAGASTAWFTGSVTVAALLRFTELTSHQIREIPTTLTLDLAGRWTTFYPHSVTTAAPLPPKGGVALLVERRAEWEALPAITSGWCQGGISCYCGHRLAFVAPQATVDALNP